MLSSAPPAPHGCSYHPAGLAEELVQLCMTQVGRLIQLKIHQPGGRQGEGSVFHSSSCYLTRFCLLHLPQMEQSHLVLCLEGRVET